ncbi:MAG: cysteine desulfurase family protein [Candidatus Paceibacterota bacterium]
MKAKKITKKRSATKSKSLSANRRIYLDFASSTPISPKVKKAVTDTMDVFYNPASLYEYGKVAKNILEYSREKVSKLLNARKNEIIFTSSGTESNNLAIFGIAKKVKDNLQVGEKKPHILVSAIEHSSVLEPARSLIKEGFDVEEIYPDQNGIISSKDIRKKIRKETVLVSIMFVNNEIGVIEPIREIAKEIRHARKTFQSEFPYFHSDASQAPCFIDVDVVTLGVDLLTLDSSKLYGPKAGILFKKSTLEIPAQILGGGQEKGIRSGTENLPAIVGFATALEESIEIKNKESARLEKLRDYFEDKIITQIKGAEINAKNAKRISGISSITINGLDSEFAVFQLDVAGIMCASASACLALKSENNEQGSYVIDAINKETGNTEKKNYTLRFSFGRSTKKSDIDFCLKAISGILSKQEISHNLKVKSHNYK